MLPLAACEAFYRAKPKVLPGVVEVLLEHQGRRPGCQKEGPHQRLGSGLQGLIRSQWLVTTSLLRQMSISVVFAWKEQKGHRGAIWDCTHLNVCQNILNLMTDGVRMLHSWGQRKEVMGLKSIGLHCQPV